MRAAGLHVGNQGAACMRYVGGSRLRHRCKHGAASMARVPLMHRKPLLTWPFAVTTSFRPLLTGDWLVYSMILGFDCPAEPMIELALIAVFGGGFRHGMHVITRF